MAHNVTEIHDMSVDKKSSPYEDDRINNEKSDYAAEEAPIDRAVEK